MKKVLSLRWIVLGLLCLALAAGCAKKPVPSTATTETPTETVMPKENVSGVNESGVTESAVSEQQAPAAASIEAAASKLQRVHFDFDQFTLSPEARQILAANAEIIKATPGLRVRIEGNCDERGSDEYNLALGERRAQAAKDYLVSLGVPADRLEVISYGEEMPLDPASNEAAWAKNRRDEFKAIR